MDSLVLQERLLAATEILYTSRLPDSENGLTDQDSVMLWRGDSPFTCHPLSIE